MDIFKTWLIPISKTMKTQCMVWHRLPDIPIINIPPLDSSNHNITNLSRKPDTSEDAGNFTWSGLTLPSCGHFIYWHLKLMGTTYTVSMETSSLVRLPVLLSNSCYQKLTRTGKLETVDEAGLVEKGEREKNMIFYCSAKMSCRV